MDSKNLYSTISKIIVKEYKAESGILDSSYTGLGEATLYSGGKYVGEFVNGLFDGKGTYTWKDGVEYQGQFKSNKICGKGVYKWLSVN
jgi:hypothetical protein